MNKKIFYVFCIFWFISLLGECLSIFQFKVASPSSPISFHLYGDVYGKNKVQQQKIDWSVIESRNFDIYFVSGHEDLGKMTVLIAENAYFHLYQFFRHPLNNRIPIIVFSSKQEFQTTNIIYPLLPEGIGGFTETLRNRVALPFDGSYKKFEDVLTHELVHAYINDMEGTFFRNPAFRGITSNLPFWFSEGLPEYLALKGTNVYNNRFIIDMIVNDQLRDIEYLGGFFAYRLGEALLVWISEEWNENKVVEYFYNVRIHADIHTASKMTFDLDFTELQDRFRFFVKRKYSNILHEMQTPWEIATRHTNPRDSQAMENIFPRFSPNGNDFVFFSTHKARTSILSGSTYQLRRDEVLLIGERTARFEEFHYQRNNLSWFPDIASSSPAPSSSLQGSFSETPPAAISDFTSLSSIPYPQSPKKIAFVAKTTFGDVIYIYDVENKKVISEREFPQFDAIYEIDISPCGSYIAITAQMANQCDLYIYNVNTEELERITQNNFFIFSPNWSHDGKKIAFVSEYPEYTLSSHPTNLESNKISLERIYSVTTSQSEIGTTGVEHDIISSPNIFGKMVQNIYYYEVETGDFYKVTFDEYNNFQPIWINDTQIAFITEKTGVANIDIIDLERNERATVTNILSGMHSFDYSNLNETLIFSVYFNNSFDIYSIINPFQSLDFYSYHPVEPISKRQINDFHDYFRTNRYRFYGLSISEMNTAPTIPISEIASDDNSSDESRIETEEIEIAEEAYSSRESRYDRGRQETDLRIDISRYFPRDYMLDLRPNTENYNEPIIKNYRPRFQIDSFWGGFAYSPAYGSVGLLQLGMSDIMGDHGIGVSMDFNGDIEESNIILSYMYLPHRIDYGFALYNFADYYLYRVREPDTNRDVYLENRQYQAGIFFLTRYPYSRFFRLDFDQSVYRYRSEWHRWNAYLGHWDKLDSTSDYIYVPQISLVFDNALYGSVGPMTGSRLTAVARHSFSQKDNTFTTFYSDLRHYTLLTNRFAIANRLYLGISEGERPENFTLTGFSGVRGVNDRSVFGTRKIATSIELRYPFIDVLRLGFPLPITITNIRGSLFTDIGTVFDKDEFRGMKDSQLHDIKLGFGLGPRINLGFFVLRFDIAWTSDFVNHSRPSYYFLLVEDF